MSRAARCVNGCTVNSYYGPKLALLYKKKKGLDETSFRSVEAAISGIEL